MANFFIDRPIFAWVLAILLCLCGTLAITSLPVEQYPDLAPPNVRVTANYPGASAQTLENTVTQVIEQNMTGLDNLMYMSSQSSATGQAHGHPELYGGHRPGRSACSRCKTSCSPRCVSCRRRCRTRASPCVKPVIPTS